MTRGGTSSLSANKLNGKAGSSTQENDKPELNKLEDKNSTGVGQKDNAGAISGSANKEKVAQGKLNLEQNKPAEQSEKGPKATPEDDGDDSDTITFHVPKPGKNNSLPADQLRASMPAVPDYVALVNKWNYTWDPIYRNVVLKGLRDSSGGVLPVNQTPDTVVIPNAWDFVHAQSYGALTGARALPDMTVSNVRGAAAANHYKVLITKTAFHNVVYHTKNLTISHTTVAGSDPATSKVSVTDNSYTPTDNFEYLISGQDLSGNPARNESLETADLANLNTSGVVDMGYMFYNADKLTTVTGLNTWNTSSVQSMSQMFAIEPASGTPSTGGYGYGDADPITGQPLGKILDLSGVNGWDVHNVQYFTAMFAGQAKIQNLDLSNWRTNNGTDFEQMFYNCSNLQSVGNLSGWRNNVNNSPSTGGSFRGMFMNTPKLTSVGNIGTWNVGTDPGREDIDASNMFNNTGITNLNLSSWFSQNGSVKFTDSMFRNDPNLTSVGNIGSWKTNRLCSMAHMFDGDKKLTQIGGADNDLSNWITSGPMSLTDSGQDFNLTYPNQIQNKTTEMTGRMARAFADTGITHLKLDGWHLSPDAGSMFAQMGQGKPVIIEMNKVTSPASTWSGTIGQSADFTDGNLPSGPLAIIAGNAAGNAIDNGINWNGSALGHIAGNNNIASATHAGDKITYYAGTTQVGQTITAAPLHFIFGNITAANNYLDEVTGKHAWTLPASEPNSYARALGTNLANYPAGGLASGFPRFLHNFDIPASGGSPAVPAPANTLLAQELGGHWLLAGSAPVSPTNPTPAPTNPRPATNPAPINSGSVTPSPVQPTQPSQVSQASQATNPAPTPEHNPRFVLTHNAFIYNLANKILSRHGKAIVLHRGRHITARHHGKKFTIKGKKFYQIGHNRYVKVSNTRRERYRIFKLTHNAFVYRLKGHKMIAKRLRLRHIVLKRGRHVRAWNNGNGIRVHGVTYYQIGRGRYIKAANTVPRSKSAYVEA